MQACKQTKTKPLKMKTKMLAAPMLAVIIIVIQSCDRTGKGNSKSIIGKWVVTDFHDSTKDAAYKDHWSFTNPPTTIIFKPDSSYYVLQGKYKPDTTKYYIDTIVRKIFIKEGVEYKGYTIARFEDSLLDILIADSQHIILSKQP